MSGYYQQIWWGLSDEIFFVNLWFQAGTHTPVLVLGRCDRCNASKAVCSQQQIFQNSSKLSPPGWRVGGFPSARGSNLPLPHVGSHLPLLKVEVGANMTLGQGRMWPHLVLRGRRNSFRVSKGSFSSCDSQLRRLFQVLRCEIDFK